MIDMLGNDEIIRELTLKEEIEKLDIEENVKERLLYKCNILNESYEETDKYLANCHVEIGELRNAVIELGKLIGNKCS